MMVRYTRDMLKHKISMLNRRATRRYELVYYEDFKWYAVKVTDSSNEEPSRFLCDGRSASEVGQILDGILYFIILESEER